MEPGNVRVAGCYLPSEFSFPRRTTIEDAGTSYAVLLSPCSMDSLIGPSGSAYPGLYCCNGFFGSNGKCDGSTICCAGCLWWLRLFGQFFLVSKWKSCSASCRRGGGNVKIGCIDFQGLVGRAENSSSRVGRRNLTSTLSQHRA